MISLIWSVFSINHTIYQSLDSYNHPTYNLPWYGFSSRPITYGEWQNVYLNTKARHHIDHVSQKSLCASTKYRLPIHGNNCSSSHTRFNLVNGPYSNGVHDSGWPFNDRRCGGFLEQVICKAPFTAPQTWKSHCWVFLYLGRCRSHPSWASSVLFRTPHRPSPNTKNSKAVCCNRWWIPNPKMVWISIIRNV